MVSHAKTKSLARPCLCTTASLKSIIINPTVTSRDPSFTNHRGDTSLVSEAADAARKGRGTEAHPVSVA